MDQNESFPTSVREAIEVARETNVPCEVDGPEGSRHLFYSDRVKMVTVEPEFKPLPERIRQAVRVDDKESAIEYINEYRGDVAAMLFADISNNAITAILDYHEKTQAQRNEHSVTLKLNYSEEWKRWHSRSGKLFPQKDFARFVEENRIDVIRPNGAELLEVVSGMLVLKKVTFNSAVRLDSNTDSFEYSDDSTAVSKSGSIAVPKQFTLRIPVYFGEEPEDVEAFLRHDTSTGQLAIGLELHRPEYVRQAAFKKVAADIKAATGQRVVYGSACAR